MGSVIPVPFPLLSYSLPAQAFWSRLAYPHPALSLAARTNPLRTYLWDSSSSINRKGDGPVLRKRRSIVLKFPDGKAVVFTGKI